MNSVFAEIEADTVDVDVVAPWWQKAVSQRQRTLAEPLPSDIANLLFLGMQHSNAISIAQDTPQIRRTAVTQADADFDWTRYLNTAWDDTSLPTSTSLQAGGTARVFEDQVAQATAGVRRRNRVGGQVDISQRFGWQDTNSVFFTPGDQATSQFTISYTHPLMRGSGRAYNSSLVVLASLDTKAASADYQATLQNELLEIVRGYWLVYSERATAVQQAKLYLLTREIVRSLEARRGIDAQQTQIIAARAALENRRSDLIRARTAVANAETRLRGLINAPSLGNAEDVELIPTEMPSLSEYPVSLEDEVHLALQMRPEARAALHRAAASARQFEIARHELLPSLNLVTQTFVNGLQGSSDFGQSFADQFSTGRPSYSIGLQYEMPFGNRRAKAALKQRQIELHQIQTQYEQALNAIQTEVDIAVRELQTAYREIGAKQRAVAAAEAEAETIELRWSRHIDGHGTAGLNLESLLRAQERVTQAEAELTLAIVTYNLAMVNLKRANGTLLSAEAVQATPVFHSAAPGTPILDGPAPADGVEVIPDGQLLPPPPLPPSAPDAPAPSMPVRMEPVTWESTGAASQDVDLGPVEEHGRRDSAVREAAFQSHALFPEDHSSN